MLKNKAATVYRLFRDGGIKGVYAYCWLRLRVWSGERKREVRIDGCTINLSDVRDRGTRIELITQAYELSERTAIRRYLRTDLPVVELGGSLGVVACVTNKRLRDPKAHVVVEANPLVIPHLQKNRQRNGCQFQVVNRAIAYGAPTISFRPSTNVAGTSIVRPGGEAAVTVDATDLARLVDEGGFEAFNLICDIEGVEYDLVCREGEVLRKADSIIMETHARFIGEEKLRTMMSKLEELGFRRIETIGFVVVLKNRTC